LNFYRIVAKSLTSGAGSCKNLDDFGDCKINKELQRFSKTYLRILEDP
jgi:hypothetical protein